jgi:hypothetical protein
MNSALIENSAVFDFQITAQDDSLIFKSHTNDNYMRFIFSVNQVESLIFLLDVDCLIFKSHKNNLMFDFQITGHCDSLIILKNI